MRRALMAMVVAAVLVAGAFAQGAMVGTDEFVGSVTMGYTVKDLATMAGTGNPDATAVLAGKAIVLFGSLSRPMVTQEEPFEAVVELLEGEWVDEATVALHRVYLVLRGEAFREFIEGIKGMRALAIATEATLGTAPDGSPAVYLVVVAIRTIR